MFNLESSFCSDWLYWLVRFLDLVLERFVSNSSFVVIVGDGGGDVCSTDVRGREESAGKWWLLVKGNLSASMCFQLFLWEVVWTTREGERLGGWSGYLKCIWGCVRVCVCVCFAIYLRIHHTPLCERNIQHQDLLFVSQTRNGTSRYDWNVRWLWWWWSWIGAFYIFVFVYIHIQYIIYRVYKIIELNVYTKYYDMTTIFGYWYMQIYTYM